MAIKLRLFVMAFAISMAGYEAMAASKNHKEPDRRQTWCAPMERIYFSCQIGRKTVSLCGSDRITKTEGYLQYHFGRLGNNPELVYPATQTHPHGLFRDYWSGWPKGYEYEIGFLNGGYNYSIYIHSSVQEDGDFNGVHIRKEGQRLPSNKFQCTGGQETYFEDRTWLSRIYDEAVLERLQ